MKSINEFTIPCTEEQTRKALELGAPLFRLYGTGCSDYIDMLVISDTEAYTIPTAEEMIGWLEENGIFFAVSCCCAIVLNEEKELFHLAGDFNRKELTMAAIDSALDHLARTKSN